MSLVVLVLIVLVVVLFSQVRALRARLDALELGAQGRPGAVSSGQLPTQTQDAPAAVPPNRPVFSAETPWPAGQGPKAGRNVPPGEVWNVPGELIPAVAVAVAPQSAPTPNGSLQREPINVQRWLTRAGLAATLLGAGYVLAVLEEQGRIGPWWRVLAGLLLGGWLSWLAVRAARPDRAAQSKAAQTEETRAQETQRAGHRQLWAAEALGSLGIGVALLTLTFAARTVGGSGPWALALTLMALASALLANRWGGLATPLVALSALSVALLLAQREPGVHLWNLSLSGLVCLVWTLSALALLPLPLRARGWRVALPGAVALALLAVFAALTELDVLGAGERGEQAGVALLVGAFALLGVLLRPGGQEGVGGQEGAGGLERGLRSLVGALALGTVSASLCRLTGLELRWAVPLAALLMVALLSVLPPRLADAGVLRRVTFSAALVAAITAIGDGLALHSGDAAGRSDWLPALACLGLSVLAAWRLTNWPWHGIHGARLLLMLALCAPLGLVFGLTGVALPPVVWLARRKTAPQVAQPGPPFPPSLSWARSGDWHPEPLAVWGLFALPLLASGALAGPELARLAETFLLLLGSAALVAFSLGGLLHPVPGRVAWTPSALLAWSGSWLLAAGLGRLQGSGTENFALTTPVLALLGGWLLFRAQPGWPGDARWKWSLWTAGAALLVFALLRVLLSDLSDAGALIRASGLLGAGLVTVLAAVRFPPPSRG